MWNTYQESIFQWCENPTGHLQIRAGAGCGKTTTIVEAFKRVKGSCLFMAFNKRIAVELQSRGVPASTINAFGFRQCFKMFKGIKVDDRKVDNICKSLRVVFSDRGSTKRAVSLLKANCVFNPSKADIQGIIDRYDLEFKEDPKVDEVLYLSLKDKYTLDFDDQIVYPLYYDIKTDTYDWVIIDEAQDLSPSKLELVSRAVGGHFICVGDPFQAIYGFAGADSGSMDKIKLTFDCEVRELPVTYRCGKSIVKECHERQVGPKEFAAGEENHEGEVRRNVELNPEPEDFVLCRCAAPLVGRCLELIKKGQRATIVGKDIGGKLVELVGKIGGTDIQDFCFNLREYRYREVGKLRKLEKDNQADELEDKLECIEVFLEGATSIDEVCGRISRVFDDNLNPEAVIFSTIHKAKGLEADNVWILPTPRVMKQTQEEKNLVYVAITRAKECLNFVGGDRANR